ncbi:tRNA dimethylallyltransferase, miaA [Lactococcus cremoris]|jgi:tRNA dimethylallyltransferase|uniref:tRNA dimethylallyltransferase n=1 Tax=Lactococcus cremoris subsp. cremoris IBB477 TaxID=1449093 RepID=A0A1E7G1Y9_LACLC|nr:tRNA (adenosine(37)-N6)-dimethylallyltransferase MiaA [Lactococcus cremoris]MCI1841597.1 tRNA (adenosine(37)-N6)-dimethylallyltransferase MiaA [Lactococcus lactis]KKW74062.1 tRNA dimethylallyltransferase, miaA [Lactococcus cremoris]KZK07456.1 tRNA dimethylallyltransferase [Lactococcus cremoris]MCT0455980.1 tRNA (adenosine(37)-N6)-dimethylallyltransferase MiaA [Lactococcus cremoris]MCT0475603.1 tRNA (adenosine(37)-N6)-dimethylallyltransferase MiaA [Lactococcus cremoris]
MKNNKVLVVVGPTAVGKTALGIDLAIKMNGEIISGDSQQVYQGLDIGTAKVTKAEQALAVHHLIDVRKWTENFSVHDFVMEANRLIKEIIERGNVPIIVGGTGLYIQSLIEGYHLGGQENHQAMMELRETLSALTDEELFEKVLKLNPNFPELNRRRAIRFLELQTFGSTDENSGSDYNFLLIGLNAERKVLYERINQRVEQMMSEGLLAEARTLFEKAPDAQAAKGIGYKEFFPYFSGEISLEEAVELVKRNSRRYAKRQLTWFRNRMEVEFEDVFSETYPDSVFEKVTQFLN